MPPAHALPLRLPERYSVKSAFPMLLDGLRAVFLCRPRNAAIGTGPSPFISLIALYLVVSLGVALLDTAQPWQFVPAGVTTVLADSLLTLLAAWILVVLAGRREIVWGVAALLLAATICTSVIVHWPFAHIASALLAREHVLSAMLLILLSRLWWLPVLFVVAHRLAPRGFGHAMVAALLAYAISAAPWWWLPQPALVRTDVAASRVVSDIDGTVPESADGDTPITPDDIGEQNQPPAFDAEQVMFNQPALLDAALAGLQPTQPGHPHLYVVAFAGDAQEDVFRNEAEYAERLFAQRFDADGRVLVLQNSAATVATRPLATWTNLHHALEAIAKKMDPAEDILLLYLTTHGSEDHQLLVDLDPLPLDQIEPEDLADALKTTPAIRWKVIVVNACYSGGFIDPVRDDSTMVITSARADRTSFGCGADSDITYFGKAFLAEALNRTTSLREAFDLATKLVGEWETADQEEHSEPQIATSRSIEAKLERWRQGLSPAPTVPFAPGATAQ